LKKCRPSWPWLSTRWGLLSQPGCSSYCRTSQSGPVAKCTDGAATIISCISSIKHMFSVHSRLVWQLPAGRHSGCKQVPAAQPGSSTPTCSVCLSMLSSICCRAPGVGPCSSSRNTDTAPSVLCP
jgi:hypothetical protein